MVKSLSIDKSSIAVFGKLMGCKISRSNLVAQRYCIFYTYST